MTPSSSPRAGISSQLLVSLIAAALLLPGLVFTGVLLWRIAEAERGRYRTEALDTARLISLAVDRDLNGLLTTLQTLTTSRRLATGDLRGFHEQASRVKAFTGADLVLRRVADGRPIVSTAVPFGAPLGNAGAAATAAAAPVVSGVFAGENGRPAFAITVPATDDRGTALLLDVVAPTDRLLPLIREGLPSGWVLGLGDREGDYLARSERHEAFSGRPGVPAFLALAEGPAGTFQGTSAGGAPVLAGYVRSPLSGWLTAASVPLSVVEAPLKRQLALLAGFGALVLLLAVGAVLWLWRLVAKPLEALALASGRVDEPVPATPARVREVRVLADALRDSSRRRDEAEAGLRRSESRARLVIESATDYAIVTTDGDGRITGWNRGAEKVFGWTRAEMLGQAAERVFTPEDRAAGRPAAEIAEALAEGRAGDERWHLRRDGTRFWASGEMQPMRDERGEAIGFLKIVRDQTEARLAAETLRSTEERYRIAARATNDAIWDWDLAGNRVLWNEAINALFGWTEGEVEPTGDWWIGRIHPEDRERVSRSIHAVIDGTGSAWTAEYRFERRDGSFADVLDRGFVLRDSEGRAVRMIGAMLDLSERKRAEGALRASEARLKAIVETAPVGLVFAEAPSGRITGGNAQAERIFGHSVLPSPDVGAYRDWIGFHADGRRVESEEYPLPPVLRGEAERAEMEVLYQRGDGREAWVRLIAAPIRDERGVVVAGVVASLDVDREKRAEEALRELNSTLEGRVEERTAELAAANEALIGEMRGREAAETQLRQLQKMEAVGQLTGGIAHDFNNMLAIVIGSLNLLGRRLERGDRDVGRFITAALDGANRAATLTQRLLAFSRRQPLRPEPIDANRLVSGMTDLLRRTLGPTMQLETVLAGDLWRARADAGQLENALLNLAVNGRDAMGGPDGGGGRLTVETANREVAPDEAGQEMLPPGQYVAVAVTDTGSGMTPEVAGRAFEPFFTTKGVGKGTGLGLSQVYGFVRQSGGHVRIVSEPGRGTTVAIFLPRFMGEAAPTRDADARPPEEPVAAGGTESVLVVDDEEALRRIAADALRELGYRVHEAGGGAAALRVLDEHPDLALLFTDMVMPEMSGRQLAEEALKRRPDLSVLFTTGFSGGATVEEDVLVPGTDLLPKPFTLAELAAKVRAALDGRG